MSLAFQWLCWRRDVSNFAMLKYRDFDGFVVTMQHSGTHWLKYMMSVAIAHQYSLEPPRYIHNASSNDLIGHPKHPRIYPRAPRLASSHSIPHVLFDSRLVRWATTFPANIVLVRDLRAALVSNYEKWKSKYDVTFAEYLRGDLRGKRFNFDLWSGIHYFNRWSRVRKRFPDAVHVLTYEHLQSDPVRELGLIFGHLNIRIDCRYLETAARAGTKDNMAEMLDPDEPVTNIVRDSEDDPLSWFSGSDRAFFDATCARLLQENFGYEFGW